VSSAPAPAPAPGMEIAGPRLRAARRARGLSLAEAEVLWTLAPPLAAEPGPVASDP